MGGAGDADLRAQLLQALRLINELKQGQKPPASLTAGSTACEVRPAALQAGGTPSEPTPRQHFDNASDYRRSYSRELEESKRENRNLRLQQEITRTANWALVLQLNAQREETARQMLSM